MPGKSVLIVDDDQAISLALVRRCRDLGLIAEASPDGLHALMSIAQNPPDLLIVDINMPAVNGLVLSEKLAQDQDLASLPIIALTGRSDEETIRRCTSLGLHYICKGLDTWNDLRPVICGLLGISDGEDSSAEVQASSAVAARRKRTSKATHDREGGPTVLVIDDDPALLKAVDIRLRTYGINVITASNGREGFFAAIKYSPDVIITDFTMPEGYGNYVISRLKRHTLTSNIPVLVLTGRTTGNAKDYCLQREMIGIGAAAFLTKPLDFAELLKELRVYIEVPAQPVSQPGLLAPATT